MFSDEAGTPPQQEKQLQVGLGIKIENTLATKIYQCIKTCSQFQGKSTFRHRDRYRASHSSTVLHTAREPESSEGHTERLTGGVNVILA